MLNNNCIICQTFHSCQKGAFQSSLIFRPRPLKLGLWSKSFTFVKRNILLWLLQCHSCSGEQPEHFILRIQRSSMCYFICCLLFSQECKPGSSICLRFENDIFVCTRSINYFIPTKYKQTRQQLFISLYNFDYLIKIK